MSIGRFASLCSVLPLVIGCEEAVVVERPPPPAHDGIYGFASGCYALDATPPGSTNTRWLEASGAERERFTFSATTQEAGARFTMRASDLGTYLFYDAERHYLVGEADHLGRASELLSDILLVDDAYRSPAEWELEVSAHDPERFQLRHYATGSYLSMSGLTASESDAAVVALYPTTGCAEFPELTLDAEGVPDGTRWADDGAVYGFVETHAHLFTNFGFGGGGMFHGSPFHRLGVEHALPSCEPFHGPEGRSDIIGYAFSGLGDTLDVDSLLTVFVTGMTPEPQHATDGYPTFTDWPSSWNSSTHQMQYYRWIERAWMGGMRLLVMHATTNSVLCEFVTGIDAQPVRYACDDMLAVDREFAETFALERYIDAQHGGPGMGWFHVVQTPAEARAVIDEGHLAVILGIETSNLFECLLTPRPGGPVCDEAYVREQLDHYYELGVRAIFPVHKFDNAFGAGDGDRNVGQIGSWINSGHWSSLIEDCPDIDSVFDRGGITFGGLNMPRTDFLAPAPNDMSGFAEAPLGTLSPFLSAISAPGIEGEFCQSHGLTPLGETLIREMMLRGIILEIDHLPRRSALRALEILEAADYPAIGTHGNTYDGRIYDIGGMAKTGFGRCADPSAPGAMGARFRERIELIRSRGGYPAEGFGFDLNGFAGGPGPRFGPDSGCPEPQANPITYPFSSFRGDVTFTEPHLGERTVDFNTEGMQHLGLVPELIEDARRDGLSDADLEPLFRSAEAYLRMWERADARAEAMRAAP